MMATMSQTFPVNDSPRFVVSTATAGQSAFSIPFPFLLSEDLQVERLATNGTRTVLERPTHFSLSGAGNPAGGTLTLKPAFLAKAGEIYTIFGQAVLSREGSVVQGGKFSSQIIDLDFDRLTIIAQEHARDIAVSVRVPFGSTPPSLEPGADGTIPIWEDGNLVEGPSAAAIEAIEAALGVDAGRALIHGEAGADPFDAGGRRISGMADGVEPDDAVSKSQLDALEGEIDAGALLERVEALEAAMAQVVEPGDIKLTTRRHITDPAGWLLLTSTRTIGNAGSGASALAGATAEACYLAVWTDYDNTACPIFDLNGNATIRGASAAADFAALKRLTLPSPAGRFPRIASDTRPTGTKEDNQNKEHAHTASFAGSAMPAHAHATNLAAYFGANTSGNRGFSSGDSGNGSLNAGTSGVSAGTPTGSVTVNNSGSDEARPDSFVLTGLIKL